LDGDVPNLYQCHCSLCRKVTGSAANAAFRIAADQFEWLSGSDQVQEFVTESGFKSHFCSTCGSPVPNRTSNDRAYWIPVGLLEKTHDLELVAHLYVASRASWDVIADAGEQFDEMPDVEDLDRLLQR
jgi:hypothetical protein